IEELLHVGAARIADDRPVSESSRPPFHTPLEPTDDLSIGYGGSGPAAKRRLIGYLVGSTACCSYFGSACLHKSSNGCGVILRPPIRMIHRKRAFSSKLMPDRKGCSDGASGVTRGGLYVDAAKLRPATHLAIRN